MYCQVEIIMKGQLNYHIVLQKLFYKENVFSYPTKR